MRTMLDIAAFELKSRLKLLSTYVYFLLYVFIAAFWMAAAGGALEDASVTFGSEKLLINGPYALAQMLTLAGFMGVSVIAASMGRAVQQDFEHGTFHFFFSAPITKRDYVLGRFLGAYASLLVVFAGIAVGAEIGIHWPGVDPARVGEGSFSAYWRPYLFIILPDMLWLGAVFFMLAALTRQMAPVYIGGVLVFIGYLMSITLIGDVENKTRAALIDPVGSMALSVLARYWSVEDRNTRPIPFEDVLLWNRMLWMSIGAVLFLVGYRMLRLDVGNRTGASKRSIADLAPTGAAPLAARIPPPVLDRRPRAWLSACPALARLYLVEIVRSPRFLAIVFAGVLFMIVNSSTMGSFYGTNTWPVTYQVLEFTSGLFGLFVLVVTAIYAGELVWRERETKMDEIVDAAPFPGWLPFLAKLVALLGVQSLLLLVVLLSTIGIQLWYGYTRFEIPHALFDLYVLQLPQYLVLGALALTIHVVVNQKYVGHFLVVLWFVISQKLPDFGIEDRLLNYGSVPVVQYSDMNGYGHFLPGFASFQVYWLAWAVVLLVVAHGLWVRGRDTALSKRLARLRGPALVRVGLPALVVAAIAGSWTAWNTHVLNPFLTKQDRQQRQVDYEKRYQALRFAPQPRISGADLDVDIFPRELRASFRGRYTLINRADQPIQDLYVNIPAIATVNRIESDRPLRLVDAAPELAWHHYRMAQPMQPGETATFSFDLAYAVKGFENNGALATVVANGTFFDVGTLPRFGYDAYAELESDRDRKKFGLAPRERALDLDDPHGPQLGVDWMEHFSATVSTDADQLAITSGTLEKQWKDGDRAYFRYRMDTKAMAFMPFLSGRYVTRKDRWTDGTREVAIEINYHPDHTYNIDRMIAGVKDSLDYYTRNFSPYQHDLLRIIEFPRYARFAESLPNTVPYSESIGFIARVDDDDPKDIDYPYFVTAHEVAHQWWGHQTTPATVQGDAFLNESLSEYSALLVLKHKYGDARMRRFLRYELDRYLVGRAGESKKEQPLMRADGPTYLHYQKGSLALYALQDVIGEQALNSALRAFVSKWAFKGPPYPTSRAVIEELRKVTPADRQYVIEDLFETITLFEFEATEATVKPLEGGRFEVTLKARAKKLRSDGLGAQQEIPMREPVDVGVLDAEGLPILLEKRTVASGENTFTFVTDKKPAKAGIDPLSKLINRHPEDGTVKVEG